MIIIGSEIVSQINSVKKQAIIPQRYKKVPWTPQLLAAFLFLRDGIIWWTSVGFLACEDWASQNCDIKSPQIGDLATLHRNQHGIEF